MGPPRALACSLAAALLLAALPGGEAARAEDALDVAAAHAAAWPRALAAVDGARSVQAAFAGPSDDPLRHALRGAVAAGAAQARLAGLGAPGEAAAAATPPEVDALLARLPEALRGPLATTWAAFAAFDAAARAGDGARVVAARAALLGTVPALRDALAGAVTEAVLEAPPFLALDLAGEDTIWTQDVALLIDAGGHDTYLNNAGGNGLAGCEGALRRAAALLDLAGDDTYGRPDLPVAERRGCGVNGGAVAGAALLLDAAGDDVYAAGDLGANGGGAREGMGLLLDAQGADRYLAGGDGANGGGFLPGLGLLVDAGAGDDVYAAGQRAVNGGGYGEYDQLQREGVGALVDAGGHDLYVALGQGANGGGASEGVGWLLDLAGDDVYLGGDDAVNGGTVGGSVAEQGGYGADAALPPDGALLQDLPRSVSLLVDAAGDDRYEAGAQGVNGGGWLGGDGLQLTSPISGGHAWHPYGGVGFLFDAAGHDLYRAGSRGINGGGYGAGAMLLDLAGRDLYAEQGTSCADCSAVVKEDLGVRLDVAA